MQRPVNYTATLWLCVHVIVLDQRHNAMCHKCHCVYVSVCMSLLACYIRCFDIGGLLVAGWAIGAAFHWDRHQADHSLVGAVHQLLGAGYLGVSCTPEAAH